MAHGKSCGHGWGQAQTGRQTRSITQQSTPEDHELVQTVYPNGGLQTQFRVEGE